MKAMMMNINQINLNKNHQMKTLAQMMKSVLGENILRMKIFLISFILI